ncbi:MAG TPA: PqqD family peptide modification chaperone [Candidatus Angelobacter sp.]|nr:PqqD family peptide modification chaperone [Candidatus Angelobacter sp.]
MTPQTAIASFPIAVEGLKVEKTETEAIVFDEVSESFHFLNPTAHSILNACNGSNTIKDIAGILALEFNCEDSELLFADVSETVKLFRDRGLVTFAVDDFRFNDESGSVVDPGELMSFVIHGVSMFPVLLAGDKALVKRTRVEDLKVGDIIVWSKTPSNTIAHRVVSLGLAADPWSIVTKGDLLLELDEPLQPGDVLGKIVAVLRGGHVQWLRQIEAGLADEPGARDPAIQPPVATGALPKKGSFNGLKVLDLREISAEAIGNIESVRDVSLVLLSPENESAWSKVDAQNVTSVITVPNHYRVYTGQPEILPELLEFSEKPLSIVVSGQLFLTDFRPDQFLKAFAHLMLSGQAYVGSAEARAALQSITTVLAGEIHVIASKHVRWIGESLIGPEYKSRNGELPLVAVGELARSQRLESIPEAAPFSGVVHKDRAAIA